MTQKLFRTNFFKHYKNKPYKYHAVVKHSETLEDLVFYQCRYENAQGKLWVRPKDMFFEKVEVNGVTKDRFQPIDFKLTIHDRLTDSTKKQLKDFYENIFNEKWNEDNFQKHLTNNKSFRLFVVTEAADIESKWVAFKLIYETAPKKYYSWLGGVSESHRGLGLSAYLIQEALETLKHLKVTELVTKSLCTNKWMIINNLKAGFVLSSIEESARGPKAVLKLKIT